MTAPALTFDLDSTLIDSVDQHVPAWHDASQESGIELSVRIHRPIGMSGGTFTRALLHESERELDEPLLARLRALPLALAARPSRPGRLPGAKESTPRGPPRPSRA
jgi:beta-phosphoglucomutase-like phosphatase (HAD superfamily)